MSNDEVKPYALLDIFQSEEKIMIMRNGGQFAFTPLLHTWRASINDPIKILAIKLDHMKAYTSN